MDEEVVPTPVSGGFGNVTPGGSIVLHLFFEHPTVPRLLTHPVDPNGIADLTVVESEEKDSFLTRTVHAMYVLSPHVARQLGAWLLNKATEAEARMAEEKAEVPYGSTS